MTFAAIADKVRTRFHSEIHTTWTGGLDVYYDNTASMDEAGNLSDGVAITTFHIRLHLLWGDSVQRSIGIAGERIWWRVGVLQVDAVQPLEQGMANVHAMVDELETAFGGVTADGVVYRRVDPQPGRRDGEFWVTPINIPFFAQEMR